MYTEPSSEFLYAYRDLVHVLPYPLASHEQTCYHFMRTSRCGYGMQCERDHPIHIQIESIRDPQTQDLAISLHRQLLHTSPLCADDRAPTCRQYARTGRCRCGSSAGLYHPLEFQGAGWYSNKSRKRTRRSSHGRRRSPRRRSRRPPGRSRIARSRSRRRTQRTPDRMRRAGGDEPETSNRSRSQARSRSRSAIRAPTPRSPSRPPETETRAQAPEALC